METITSSGPGRRPMKKPPSPWHATGPSFKIGEQKPSSLGQWEIRPKEFRENLQWAEVVPGDRETSPGVSGNLSGCGGWVNQLGLRLEDGSSNPGGTHVLGFPIQSSSALECS